MSKRQPNYRLEEHAGGLREFVFGMGIRTVRVFALPNGDKGWVLIDGGLCGHLNEILEGDDLPGHVDGIVITHADADHIGGVAEAKESFRDCEVICHELDRAWCENHDQLVAERYGCARAEYGFAYPEEVREAMRTACGDDFRVTRTVAAGSSLAIGGKSWRVLHLPGHSPGHIGLWQEKERVLIGGDAVLGYGPPDVKGAASMPPTHQFIREYLSTLQFLAQLPVEQAYFAHWEPLNADGLRQLIRESHAVVARDLAWLLEGPAGSMSFEQLLDGMNDTFACWDESERAHYQYALVGYLDYLREHGVAII